METVNKVILVLSDGLRYDAAVAGMGYLAHLVEYRLASLYKVKGELPTMSRPMYETVHTGVPVHRHGVTSNRQVRLSNQPNIFQCVRQAGKTTAAAAYSWFAELYNRVPYDPVNDREVDDESLNIQHGRFYTQDEFPDIELFQTAAMLLRRFSPDYLLVHPMGMDDTGERYGGTSSEYRNHAIRQDVILANLIPEWLERGRTILVTGDHGMNADRMHGGNTLELREVPLFVIRPDLPGRGDTGEEVSHLQIAPTICRLLGIPVPSTMEALPIVVCTQGYTQG